jgi:hypothetical protein
LPAHVGVLWMVLHTDNSAFGFHRAQALLTPGLNPHLAVGQ